MAIQSFLQINPENKFVKTEHFEVAKNIVTQFLELNEIPLPKMKIENNLDNYGMYYYKRKLIVINLKRTRVPVKNPGFSWTFPGYKADLTVYGVFAHETGHHISNLMKHHRDRKIIRDIRQHERNLSSYEPNYSETIAEAVKVFILNPELLRIGRPLRWKYLTEHCNLKPLHSVPWTEILKFANSKFHKAARNWAIIKEKH